VGKYQAVLDILRTIGDIKILSSPRVMALNNQEAKILVGRKDAYITSNISQAGTGTTVTAQSVNFVDTGIQLGVTPTISRDGFVTMKIKPQISDAVFQDLLSNGQKTTVPIVTTSEAETTVTVKDGVTVIIGGLTKDNRTKTVKKIPLLGDIPGVGYLFRSTDDNVTKIDLVILLTPHIMTGETSFTDFSQMKPVDGAVLKMEGGKVITTKISSLSEERVLGFLEPDKTGEPYDRQVSSKILESARMNSPKGKTGKVELSFLLSSKGGLIDEPKVLNATDTSLIPFALNAIKSASPFPYFPSGIKETVESFSITIAYK
jgi:Flp pilus assembly secretin CpaC